MKTRLELHEELVKILGSKNVYFQPPESLKLNYPAIVYSISDIINTFACDDVYNQSHFYKVTVLDYNPDSEISNKISKLPKAKFNTFFTSDRINHYVYTIYY